VCLCNAPQIVRGNSRLGRAIGKNCLRLKMTLGGYKINRADVSYENRLQSRNKRAVESAALAQKQQPAAPPPQDDASSENVRCCLIGLHDNIPKAEKWINDTIQALMTTETVSFELTIPSAIKEELPEIRKKYGLILKQTQNQVSITGLTALVIRAKTDILELERAASKSYTKPPSHWVPQKESLEIKEVASDSETWKEIQKRMQETIPSIKIHQIHRIQNLLQWEKYSFLKERIQRKTDPQEMFLFHGTRTNPPKVIYEGEEGFDMRYCERGMWGIASYFARNASYSHGYSSSLPSGLRQMFYVRAIVGKNHHIAPNGALRKPADGYDSVSGETNGSVVYMVYENGRAYPEFLITYST